MQGTQVSCYFGCIDVIKMGINFFSRIYYENSWLRNYTAFIDAGNWMLSFLLKVITMYFFLNA